MSDIIQFPRNGHRNSLAEEIKKLRKERDALQSKLQFFLDSYLENLQESVKRNPSVKWHETSHALPKAQKIKVLWWEPFLQEVFFLSTQDALKKKPFLFSHWAPCRSPLGAIMEVE